ncbi:DNA-methyltransferase [Haloquadratum walsbyi]|jgi:site-specific DNA-methyltransferase (adenine-specific)|uniref:Type II methyltransferase n=1 Tax=Haloquadratum walsbyi (strain DSM 16854 / JCM 12705 / C23) TaxID=768065 RepID=G0LKS9_HALWC|nr:site-specific DNA-methyltransferase [Haloquadratum walsbyi]CCC40037.1 site-specific DNA-methyltransferase [Haloquadratum walsbyi C23]
MEEYELSNGVIHRGDCLDGLRELAEDAITLGFTSPPYFNAVNYEEHVEKVHGNTDHWEREEMSYDDYQDFLIKRFEEVFRVTRPGGHTIVNISPVHWEDERVALPFHLVGWMEDIGWTFKEDIIWEKPVAKDRRSGVLLQNPYPGYYYPSVVAEYVLVFQKEADDENKNNIYWNRTEEEKTKNEISLDDYQGEKSKNVWKIRQVAPGENEHPAPFPRELAERVIQFYSYQDDTVMDIFAGSGQTLLAAQDLDREFIGFETQHEYVEYAKDRVIDESSQMTLEDI